MENSFEPNHYGEFKEKDLANILSTDTLYVPASILMSFNPYTVNEKEKEDNVFKYYAFKYRICTDSELIDVFSNKKNGKIFWPLHTYCPNQHSFRPNLHTYTIVYTKCLNVLF